LDGFKLAAQSFVVNFDVTIIANESFKMQVLSLNLILKSLVFNLEITELQFAGE